MHGGLALYWLLMSQKDKKKNVDESSEGEDIHDEEEEVNFHLNRSTSLKK